MYGPTLRVSEEVDATKYRQDGETFIESIERLADIVYPEYRNETKDMLANQRFLAAGRIRNAVGAKKAVTAFNCYVMKDIPDNLEGIMDVLKDGAMTSKLGGGTGYNFSKIRPNGTKIGSLGSTASGPVSYMHIYDAMGKTIASAGERRAAMMFVLRVDHPDIEHFISVKTTPGVLTGANLSIAVTDEFMLAVEDNRLFDLAFEGKVYNTIWARELWDKIMQATWDWAEPGVLFIDRINEMNNLWYAEEITATNPCAEQPLPADGACLLGSHNLVKYLRKQDGRYIFDYKLFVKDVNLSVRFLDRVIDSTIYPLEAQEKEAKSKRRMGIGVTGVANAIEAMGHPYGSPMFLNTLESILMVLRNEAYRTSVQMAKEFGAFELFTPEYLKSKFVRTLPQQIQDDITTYGIRNSHLLSIAPTGSISLSADNISSGIEPVFSHSYIRKINMPGGQIEELVEDYGVRVFGVKGKTALELTPDEHIAVLTLTQKYVDSAVSKTVNIGDDVTYGQFKDVYLNDYRNGAKGCTTFRAGGKRLGILTVDTGQPEKSSEVFSIPGVHDTDTHDESCTFDPVTGRKTCE